MPIFDKERPDKRRKEDSYKEEISKQNSFVDNRPEAIKQRKIQEAANNSPQVQKARHFADVMNGRAPAQLQQEESEKETNTPEQDELELTNLLRYAGVLEKPVSGQQNGAGASTKVTPEVALKMLDNISKGEPAFKPELGKGGASWFVTEGAPYVGISPDKTISIPAELSGMEEAIRFDESKLRQMHTETVAEVKAEAEAKYRKYMKIDKATELNAKQRKGFARYLDRFAESRMWDKVGQEVARSSSKTGEVVLESGSKFSKTPGKFGVVADANKIKIKGGIQTLVQKLIAAGKGAEPTVSSAAKEWARQKSVGKVQGVFRYGGRVLIVVGATLDAIRIYRAEDRLKETVNVAGGWAGALAFGSAFAAWFTPADVAGPGAWIAHGVGTLVAGGIGYFVGSESTQYLYELIVED